LDLVYYFLVIFRIKFLTVSNRYILPLVCVLFVISNSYSQETPDWNRDISCIIHSHCGSCHNDNGVAPFSLIDYDDVFNRRFLVMDNILSGEMPPWPAKFPEREFIGDHSLSDEEIKILEDWIVAGAPESLHGFDSPGEPVFENTEQYPDADLVIELPEYKVPPLSDNDLYKCFVFPVDMPQDVFVKAIEVIPGNPRAVHHVLLYHDTSNIPNQLDAADPEIGYTCFGGIGSNNAQLIGGWAPGGNPQVFPENMGIRIPAKTNLVVQVHYPEYAVGEVDQTHINLELTTEDQREIFVLPVLNHFTAMVNGPLVIPANELKEFFQLWTVPFAKLTLIGIAPHAHLICTEMEAWAEKPNGERIDLVHTPKWDFDWQKFYGYKRPIILEGGMQVYGRAVYDNTVNNHHNPNNPPSLITLGEDTDEEMMLFFLTITAYQSGDENLVFDSSSHFDHYDDCGGLLSNTTELVESNGIVLFPNPADDYILIESSDRIDRVIVYDASGRKLKDERGEVIKRLDVNNLEPGVFAIQLFYGGKSTVKLQSIN